MSLKQSSGALVVVVVIVSENQHQ